MSISIILLIDSNMAITRQCLEFIRKNADIAYDLIVVADESDEDLIHYLQVQGDLRLVPVAEKIGIAMGYNRGLAAAGAEYVLLMTQYSLLSEGSVSSLLRCLQSEATAAMVGPVSNDVSGHQNIKVSYNDLLGLDEFARINQNQHHRSSRRVFRLLSHCLLARREVLEEIGGFDERFGRATYEDDDLCLRLVNQGYSLYIALDAFVHYINPLDLPTGNRLNFYALLRENKQKALDKWGFNIAEYLHKARVPITISLCMIVKNEEEVLPRCLDSVKDICEEIILVDTGSGDDTKNIARRYTDRVYDFPWIDDFAAARNFAFSQATKEYILWLDADDVILEEDRKRLLELKKTLDPSVDSVTMKYHLGFDRHGNVTVSLRRSRLVKRVNQFKWIGAVHEYLAVGGNIRDSDIAVTHKRERHDSDRNLRIYQQREAAGEFFTARDQFYFANEWMDHKIFDKAIEWYRKFLDGGEGWVEDNLSACKKMADCFNYLGDRDSAVKCLFRSFLYDSPRAEFCCRLGKHFLLSQQLRLAIFWYELATKLEKPENCRGPLENECWTWLPHIQLCVCYDRIGKYEPAYEHNESAAAFIPDDPRIISNREYLKKRLGLG